jgi:hypothetical protein
MRHAVFLPASVAAHAAVAWALLPALPSAETPRLAPAPITVSLLATPLAKEAMQAAGQQARPQAEQHQTTNPPAQPAAQRAAQADDWLPSGKLTRLPVPLDQLDLSTNAQGYSGRVELVLLVDRYGRVREVRSRAQDSDSQRFAAALAPRFQAARFSPGEVNGVPVNAVVKIAVVSEAVPATPL